MFRNGNTWICLLILATLVTGVGNARDLSINNAYTNSSIINEGVSVTAKGMAVESPESISTEMEMWEYTKNGEDWQSMGSKIVPYGAEQVRLTYKTVDITGEETSASAVSPVIRDFDLDATRNLLTFEEGDVGKIGWYQGHNEDQSDDDYQVDIGNFESGSPNARRFSSKNYFKTNWSVLNIAENAAAREILMGKPEQQAMEDITEYLSDNIMISFKFAFQSDVPTDDNKSYIAIKDDQHNSLLSLEAHLSGDGDADNHSLNLIALNDEKNHNERYVIEKGNHADIYNKWRQVHIYLDLDNDVYKLVLDGQTIGGWHNMSTSKDVNQAEQPDAKAIGYIEMGHSWSGYWASVILDDIAITPYSQGDIQPVNIQNLQIVDADDGQSETPFTVGTKLETRYEVTGIVTDALETWEYTGDGVGWEDMGDSRVIPVGASKVRVTLTVENKEGGRTTQTTIAEVEPFGLLSLKITDTQGNTDIYTDMEVKALATVLGQDEDIVLSELWEYSSDMGQSWSSLYLTETYTNVNGKWQWIGKKFVPKKSNLIRVTGKIINSKGIQSQQETAVAVVGIEQGTHMAGYPQYIQDFRTTNMYDIKSFQYGFSNTGATVFGDNGINVGDFGSGRRPAFRVASIDDLWWKDTAVSLDFKENAVANGAEGDRPGIEQEMDSLLSEDMAIRFKFKFDANNQGGNTDNTSQNYVSLKNQSGQIVISLEGVITSRNSQPSMMGNLNLSRGSWRQEILSASSGKAYDTWLNASLYIKNAQSGSDSYQLVLEDENGVNLYTSEWLPTINNFTSIKQMEVGIRRGGWWQTVCVDEITIAPLIERPDFGISNLQIVSGDGSSSIEGGGSVKAVLATVGDSVELKTERWEYSTDYGKTWLVMDGSIVPQDADEIRVTVAAITQYGQYASKTVNIDVSKSAVSFFDGQPSETNQIKSLGSMTGTTLYAQLDLSMINVSKYSEIILVIAAYDVHGRLIDVQEIKEGNVGSKEFLDCFIEYRQSEIQYIKAVAFGGLDKLNPVCSFNRIDR